MSNAGKQQIFGVFELEWSWPLHCSALGLDLKLRTHSGLNHILIPSQSPDTGRLVCELPQVLIEDSLSWGWSLSTTESRVQSVGLQFFSGINASSVRIDEIRRALVTVSEWIAWLTEEPLHIEPRIHEHDVPLFVRSTGQRLSAPYCRLEHQGTAGAYATREQIEQAIGNVSAGRHLSIAQHLWCQARTYRSGRSDRNAVVSAMSAAEVAIEESIRQATSSRLSSSETDDLLKSAGGLVQKAQVLTAIAKSPLLEPFPSMGKLKQLAGVRNKAIHSGAWPGPADVGRALNASRDVIVALSC